MKVFAIGDLHLSFLDFVDPQDWEKTIIEKPMDVFGSSWGNYYQKIYDNWSALIKKDDAVLIPGDISWAMTLDEAVYDFDFLSQLPGKIYISKGNHDYWWQGIGNLRKFLPENIIPLNHDSAVIGGKAVCATRGWILPQTADWQKEDEKIYKRELLRLEMSLKEGSALNLPLAVMMHYMPCYRNGEPGEFIKMMQNYGVELCIYGHLHGNDCQNALCGDYFGLKLANVSCDCLGFIPQLLWDTEDF